MEGARLQQNGVPAETAGSVVISENNGFSQLETDGVSGLVFVRDGEIYKLSKRNSVERLTTDLEEYKKRLGIFASRIIQSDIMLATYEGETYACVRQPFIENSELRKLEEKEFIEGLKFNKDFLLVLLDFFFDAIAKQEKYPDIVGYPSNPDYRNIINLLLHKETGQILLCDIGLSPHDDTLKKWGASFYASENVKTYVVRMKEFRQFLLALQASVD
jgi:hypothetical protein